MRFVDTNVFLRHLTGDDAQKAAACRRLLTALDAGTETALTSECVIAEIVYVLSRLYKLPRDQIATIVPPLLSLRGLDVPGVVARSFDVYASNRALDFEDAVTVAHMESRGITALYSYDRGFDSVAGITRIEPY